MATPAKAALRALHDATERWPERRRTSDGIMGDARHQARKSDHNDGNAVDVSHDPSGCHGDIIAGHAIADRRARYVIWNRRINMCRGAGWRPYQGSNPHTSHVHISLHNHARDIAEPWGWADPERDGHAILRADGELARAGVKERIAPEPIDPYEDTEPSDE